MREYPINSPQAAARVVALAVVFDGRLSRTGMEAIRQLGVPEQLGLDGPDWYEVLTRLCQDLLFTSGTSWAQVCEMNPAVLRTMLDEVTDPRLQRKVLELTQQLAQVDAGISGEGARVLEAASRYWDTPLRLQDASRRDAGVSAGEFERPFAFS